MPDKPVEEDDDSNTSGIISEDLTENAKIFVLSGVDISTINGQVVLSGSWKIEGLTEYGKTLSEIKIPDTLAGLPVEVIEADVFAGNQNIRKITFGVNINSVGVEAFKNCSALEGIYITSLDPNSFHPANGILDGADKCFIYIPEKVFASDYLTDYFWGALINRLRSY